MDAYRQANMSNWDDRVPIHTGPSGYSIKELVDDPDHITEVVMFDRTLIGDVAGQRLLHPQCHIGTDTLSWAKLGATVTGIDFSAPALRVARTMAKELKVDARFIEAELYDSCNLIDEQFDLVYTGVGAICWLPDINEWAKIMARFVRPGGRFYIRDGHPMLLALQERQDDQLVVGHPYFETQVPTEWDETQSYLGEGEVAHSKTYEWNHGLGEIVTALISSGFVIESLNEHQFLDWKALPQMTLIEGAMDCYQLPIEQRDQLPLMFSIVATMPS